MKKVLVTLILGLFVVASIVPTAVKANDTIDTSDGPYVWEGETTVSFETSKTFHDAFEAYNGSVDKDYISSYTSDIVYSSNPEWKDCVAAIYEYDDESDKIGDFIGYYEIKNNINITGSDNDITVNLYDTDKYDSIDGAEKYSFYTNAVSRFGVMQKTPECYVEIINGRG